MSWMQKLLETYERCAVSGLADASDLLPIAHTTQRAHIEVVIDGDGIFRRARLVERDETGQPCVLPATERSAGRTSGEAPHPLCDKLQYCARDYKERGGTKVPYFASYEQQLAKWCDSPHSHAKAAAVLRYVRKGTLVADLIRAGVLAAPNGRLLLCGQDGNAEQREPDVGAISKRPRAPRNRSVIEPGDAFVRWRVESRGELATGTWEDRSLQKAWQRYEASQHGEKGLCAVTGYSDEGQPRVLAEQHPAKIRHSGDKAKLISSNDESGFTYRGRFVDARQAIGVSFEVTQKAHSALRWLIGRQGFRNGDQVFVAWTISGRPIPDPLADTMALLGVGPADETALPAGDVGRSFAHRLGRTIAGYRASLDNSDEIVVMGLDSATTGRLAITFYRELRGSEFLERLRTWHEVLAWHQDFGNGRRFVGAPSPKDIAEAAYGRRLDEKQRKTTVERMMPCIIDGQRIPFDLVVSCARRASTRHAVEGSEWEKCLGIACSLHRGFYKEREYSMALEEGRKTRDYLYGRLLAIAEDMESLALRVADEKRDTTAARLFQRFADRPYSTWRSIELALGPYKSRLRASRYGFLWNREKQLDEILASFSCDDPKEAFTNDRPLSGEFLLAYHCQRLALRAAPDVADSTSPAAD